MGKLYGHKFKVGDKVEVIKDNYEHEKGQIREIAEVLADERTFDYRLVGGGFIAEHNIKLVEEPKFKKGDFVYYIDCKGRRVERVVQALEDDGIIVRFTNGNFMPTKEVYLDHAIRATGAVTAKIAPKGDNVNQPAHYTAGGIETLDYIKAKLSKEEIAGYYAGNILKYVSRYKQKNGVEDLKKAEFYLRELIELQEVEHEDGFMGE